MAYIGRQVRTFFRQTCAYNHGTGGSQDFNLSKTLSDYAKTRVTRIFTTTAGNVFTSAMWANVISNTQVRLSGSTSAGTTNYEVEIIEYKNLEV